MRKLLTAAAVLGLAATAMLVPSDDAGARLGVRVAPPGASEPEPHLLVAYGEHADGGALVEAIDLETGRRRVIEDTRGAFEPDRRGGLGGDVDTTAFDPSDRCTNGGEFTHLTPAGATRYWHTVEEWNFDPDNVPATVPNWRGEVQAANDIWQDAVNPSSSAPTGTGAPRRHTSTRTPVRPWPPTLPSSPVRSAGSGSASSPPSTLASSGCTPRRSRPS